MNQTKSLRYRLLEIIPGALIWTTFILAGFLSFKYPLAVIIYVILFDIYWVLRVVYFGIYLGISWKEYQKNINIDWLAKVKKINGHENIYHLIILPTFKEGEAILRASFSSLAKVNYDKDKFIVVLAGEERDRENFLRDARLIADEFKNNFGKLLVTVHPDNLPGEIRGKGSNAHYAGQEAKKLIDILNIPYENIIISVFDIDTIAHPEYFAYLTYIYLNHPKRTRTSYQPVAVYATNIWESSAPVRIAAFGTTFWLMTELARPERLLTFSSHSMPFQALIDVGFHDKAAVSEDSRIFLQCLLRYDGDYSVTPLYMPVFMNTVQTKGYWRSLKNLYLQQRRWAYGAENIPYMIWGFARNKIIPLKIKIKYVFNLAEGMYSWATAPVLIFVLGRLPLHVASEDVKSFALVSNTPFTLEFLMTAAMLGVLLSAVFSLFLLPARPAIIGPNRILIMLLQWILLPITFVVFGAFPAIDAQTRLMLGRYLGFWVTEKSK